MKNCSICHYNCNVFKISNPPVCQKCYYKEYRKRYEQPRKICSRCGEERPLDNTIEKLCHKCYLKKYDPELECCSICEVESIVETRDLEGKPICRKCYKKTYTNPVKITCKACNKESENYKGYCHSCYNKTFPTPKRTCLGCSKQKKIVNKSHNFCANCYNKLRAVNDPQFRIRELLRHRFLNALKRYTKCGKIGSSKQYGIDYQKIIDCLGRPPDDGEKYHIDHKIPLSYFDLSDVDQIKIAFAPENHQWLKAKDNIQKGDNFSKDDLTNLLNKIKK